jgi:hypothetical protein
VALRFDIPFSLASSQRGAAYRFHGAGVSQRSIGIWD